MKIKRRLRFLFVMLVVALLPCACSQGNVASDKNLSENHTILWADMVPTSTMELQYGEQFSVDYYDSYALLTVGNSEQYLIVPENCEIPDGVDDSIVIIQQPITKAYLQATSAMDLVCEIGAVSNIAFAGTKRDGWYIRAAQDAFDEGNMQYAGNYSAPDFELLVADSCDLAIESTMIYHNPEIKEQLEQLGIPVFVERSSYESHPLGRLEWIKVYGLLFDRYEEAVNYYDSQVNKLSSVDMTAGFDQDVAFFYVTSNGSVSVKKSDDYVSKMIQLAGGNVISWESDEEENARSSMTIQMEAFYQAAKDADYLIYNSSIDDELRTMNDLILKSPLFEDFEAVKNNRVWCTGKNMFQESTGVGDMILDIYKILENPDVDDSELVYLHRVLW